MGLCVVVLTCWLIRDRLCSPAEDISAGENIARMIYLHAVRGIQRWQKIMHHGVVARSFRADWCRPNRAVAEENGSIGCAYFTSAFAAGFPSAGKSVWYMRERAFDFLNRRRRFVVSGALFCSSTTVPSGSVAAGEKGFLVPLDGWNRRHSDHPSGGPFLRIDGSKQRRARAFRSGERSRRQPLVPDFWLPAAVRPGAAMLDEGAHAALGNAPKAGGRLLQPVGERNARRRGDAAGAEPPRDIFLERFSRPGAGCFCSLPAFGLAGVVAFMQTASDLLGGSLRVGSGARRAPARGVWEAE